jgi:hypothetical protein
MLDRQIKFMLRIGASASALLAVITLMTPASVAIALGLPLGLDPAITLWGIRLSALVTLNLAAFMALAAAFFPERALRQSGTLMIIFSLATCILLLIAPAAWNWGRVLCLTLIAIFTAFYLRALRARRRHR